MLSLPGERVLEEERDEEEREEEFRKTGQVEVSGGGPE